MKCQFNISEKEKALCIVAPEERIIPGRLLREIVANIETKYQIYEYFYVASRQETEGIMDVVGMVPLAGLTQRYIVFTKLDPSFMEENAIHPTPEEEDHFRSLLDPDEEYVQADYTVSLPEELNILVTEDIKRFITVADHLKLRSYDDMLDVAERLGEAAITILSGAEMTVVFNDDDFIETFCRNGSLEEWLYDPIYVPSIFSEPETKKKGLTDLFKFGKR